MNVSKEMHVATVQASVARKPLVGALSPISKEGFVSFVTKKKRA